MPQISAIFSGRKSLIRASQRFESRGVGLNVLLVVEPSSTITLQHRVQHARRRCPGLNCSIWVAYLRKAWPRGSHDDQGGAALRRLLEEGRGDRVVLRRVGADHDGARRRPRISVKGAVTAPEPMHSISAATEDAWQSRVQWSTLLVPKPWRTSFWKR